jgi:hypothetical protein
VRFGKISISNVRDKQKNNPRNGKSKNNKPVGREGQKTMGLYKKINMT